MKITLPQKRIFSRFVIQLLLIMFIVEFIKGALLITILPVYMGTFLGASTLVIGWTLSVQYIGDNLLRSPFGWVIDRIGYRASILSGVVATFAAVAIISLTSQYLWIVAACALLGMGTAPLWPCVVTGTTEAAGEKARGTIMSVIYIAWLTGTGLGPVVINFFISESYNAAFRLLIILMVATVLIALFLPAHSKKKSISSDDEKSHKVSKNKLEQLRSYFRQISDSITVSKLIYPAMFAQTFALGLLTPVLTLYSRTVLNLSPHQYSLFLISGGSITILSLYPVGKLVDRWGTKWFLYCGFLMSSMTMFVFPFIRSIPALFILVVLVGLGYALTIPSWSALIASAIPASKRGAIWGFFLTIEGLGMIIGPIVSGMMWDNLGPKVPFLASGAVLFVLMILLVFIRSDHKRGKRIPAR